MSDVSQRLPREAPLPAAMQGRWVDVEDADGCVVIDGGRISCCGAIVEYDYKIVSSDDGALTVSLQIEDKSDPAQDNFARANITGLVVTPEGEFFAYNVKFVLNLVRADASDRGAA